MVVTAAMTGAQWGKCLGSKTGTTLCTLGHQDNGRLIKELVVCKTFGRVHHLLLKQV